jgi:hypothetical protein
MLKVSLQYFLTEFAGLDYNLTGFTPGITTSVWTGQVFFVLGFIHKKGRTDPDGDTGRGDQRSFMVQQSYGLMESHGWLPDVLVFGVSGVNTGLSENTRELSASGGVKES